MNGNLIGRVFAGRYRVDSFVASGGMGAVYRVWDLQGNAPLAMKVLHSEMAEDPAVLKYFRREADALRRLSHPNIVPFYGIQESNELVFMLQGFIDGPSLKDVLKQQKGGTLPVATILTCLKSLCAALGYAHINGVVHCDVKPGNVLIDLGGKVYLTDFGVARYAESSTTTLAGAGSPAYMAPEQIRGQPVSAATDVYGLGVILFEMLTGRRPFTGTEAETVNGGATGNERMRYAHLRISPPDPRSVNSAISPSLAQVILKALAKNPRDRFQSMQDFFLAVCASVAVPPDAISDRLKHPERWIPQPEPLISSPPQPVSPPIQPGKKPSYVLALAVMLGLASLAGILIWMVSRIIWPPLSPTYTPIVIKITDQPPPTNTTLPKTTSTGVLDSSTPDVDATVKAAALSTQIAAQSATQTAIAISSSPDVPSKTPATPPPPTPPSKTTTTSINGKWIAYDFGPKQIRRDLYMLSVETGESKLLQANEAYGYIWPTFSPDGRHLAYTRCRGNDCQIFVFDLNTEVETQLTSVSGQAMLPNWCHNPEYPWIVFEHRVTDYKDEIWAVNVETQKTVQLTRGEVDTQPAWSPNCDRIVFGQSPTEKDFTDISILYVDPTTMTPLEIEPLIISPNIDESSYAWSPDGEAIAYCRVRNDTNGDGYVNLNDQSELWLVSPDDGNNLQSLIQSQYSVFSPSWSPDGSKIVFTDYNYRSDSRQIIVLDIITGDFTVLTDRDYYWHPVWSPR